MSSSSLSDLITCAVCFEAYTLSERHTPFHLSCAHTFCISCLTGLISNSSIACPACREITHIPNNVPCQQVLKRNFTVIALLEQQQGEEEAEAQVKSLEDERDTDEKEIQKSTKKNKNARKRANKKAKKAAAEAIPVPQEIKDDANVANTIFQFRIHLSNITPQIWRTFEVPANLNFRQFHAVIQDVMGWYCCHLHNFKLKDPNSGVLGGEIQLMDYQADKYEAPEDMLLQMHPGMSPAMRASMTAAANRVIRMYERNIKLCELITLHSTNLTYEYDFGDSWEHQLTLQAITNRQQGVSYPRVTGGARACPPEDVGGPYGYAEFLSIINNPNHREYHDRCDWLRNHVVNYYPFKSEEFNPAKIPWKCVEFEKSQPDQQPD